MKFSSKSHPARRWTAQGAASEMLSKLRPSQYRAIQGYTRLYKVQKQSTAGHAEGGKELTCKPCELKRRLSLCSVYGPGSYPRTVSVWPFLDLGVGQPPKVGPTVCLLMAFVIFQNGERGS